MTNPTTDGQYRVLLQKEQLVFSAAHFITFAGDICECLHGHNYGVKAEVAGPLDENQYVIDFIAFRDALAEIIKQLDHRVLLPTKHPLIAVHQSDAEVTASFRDKRWVFRPRIVGCYPSSIRRRSGLPGGLRSS